MSDPTRRNRVFAKTGGRCWYCGVTFFGEFGTRAYGVIDHVTPKADGGSNRLDNLVPACWGCNSLKRNKDLEEFRVRLQEQRSSAARALKHLYVALEELNSSEDLDLEAGWVEQTIRYLKTRIPSIVFHGEKGQAAEEDLPYGFVPCNRKEWLVTQQVNGSTTIAIVEKL